MMSLWFLALLALSPLSEGAAIVRLYDATPDCTGQSVPLRLAADDSCESFLGRSFKASCDDDNVHLETCSDEDCTNCTLIAIEPPAVCGKDPQGPRSAACKCVSDDLQAFDLGIDASQADVEIVVQSSWVTRVVRELSSDIEQQVISIEAPGMTVTMESPSPFIRRFVIVDPQTNGSSSQTYNAKSQSILRAPSLLLLLGLFLHSFRASPSIIASTMFISFAFFGIASDDAEVVIYIAPVIFNSLTISTFAPVSLEPDQYFADYTNVTVAGDECPLPCLGLCREGGVCDCDANTQKSCEPIPIHFGNVESIDPLFANEADGAMSGFARADKTWRETIRWCFLEAWEERNKEMVRRGIAEWKKYGNFQVQEVSDCAQASVRITGVGNPSCASYVGTNAKQIAAGRPTIWLRCILESRSDALSFSYILHEFGHALGLEHEHQNPGMTIAWNWAAIYRSWCGSWQRDGHESLAKCEENARFNIGIAFSGQNDLVTAYDAASIMNYAWPASWTTNGISQDRNLVLSRGDQTIAATLYPGAAAPSPSGFQCSHDNLPIGVGYFPDRCGTSVGRTCTFGCRLGYGGNNVTRKCTSSGYDGVLPTCSLIMCPAPTFSNPVTSNCIRGPVGTACTVSCGTQSARWQCDSSGKYVGTIPACACTCHACGQSSLCTTCAVCGPQTANCSATVSRVVSCWGQRAGVRGTCNCRTGSFTPSPTTRKKVGESCSTSTDCEGANVYCNPWGICGGRGASCRTTSDCDGITCSSGQCGGRGARCRTQSDCVYRCNQTVCTDRLFQRVGQQCWGAVDCAGINVFCGTSVCGGKGASCRSKEDCVNSCSNGACTGR